MTDPQPEEREAVVRWLRDTRTALRLRKDYGVYRKDGVPTAQTYRDIGVTMMALMDAADAIERGAHLNSEAPHE